MHISVLLQKIFGQDYFLKVIAVSSRKAVAKAVKAAYGCQRSAIVEPLRYTERMISMK